MRLDAMSYVLVPLLFSFDCKRIERMCQVNKARTSSPLVHGTSIPTCCLNDLPPTIGPTPAWPCQQEREQAEQGARTQLLWHAGLLRFAQKTRAFVELLAVAHSQGPFSSYDTCLISALAEGLGYGRDRAFFRAADHYLLGMVAAVPEPLDAGRLRAMHDLIERWRVAHLVPGVSISTQRISPPGRHMRRTCCNSAGNAAREVWSAMKAMLMKSKPPLGRSASSGE
jgi:hypothetical protein